MDQSCCAALLDISRPVLSPGLADRLARWDELDDEARERAGAELRMMAEVTKF